MYFSSPYLQKEHKDSEEDDFRAQEKAEDSDQWRFWLGNVCFIF